MKKRFDIAIRPFAMCATALALTLLTLHAASRLAQAQSGRGLGIVEISASDGSRVRLYDQSYALVIGESEYKNGWHRLDGVKSDVKAVRAALEGHGFQVIVVENADGSQLESAFADFIRQYGMQEQNRLLFYFAGHGFTRRQSYGEEMGYIVPVDAPNPRDDPSGFMSKAMDLEQIERYAKRIQSKHALFIFDSCFSGTLFATTRGVPDSISNKTARHVREFITSGSADETVPDKSVFREQFVAALAGEADVNHDGFVTGTELGEFLQDRVTNYTRNAQHPQYGKIRDPNLDKGDFVFALSSTTALPVAPNVGQPSKPAAPTVDLAEMEQSYWDAIKDSSDANDFKAYLKKYPDGRFANDARDNIRRLAAAAPVENQNKHLPVKVVGVRSGAKWGRITLLTSEIVSATKLGADPGALSRALSQKLISGGVRLILLPTSSTDPHDLTVSRLRDEVHKLQLGDRNAAKKIPFAVVIMAEFQVRELPSYDGLHVAEVNGTVRAIDGDTGEIVTLAILPNTRGFGNTSEQARDKALASAVENIPATFIEQVINAAG